MARTCNSLDFCLIKFFYRLIVNHLLITNLLNFPPIIAVDKFADHFFCNISTNILFIVWLYFCLGFADFLQEFAFVLRSSLLGSSTCNDVLHCGCRLNCNFHMMWYWYPEGAIVITNIIKLLQIEHVMSWYRLFAHKVWLHF